MPVPLGQFNSFNSSGATIIPDDRRRSARNQSSGRNVYSNGRQQGDTHLEQTVSQSRALGRTDSLGRELEALLAGPQQQAGGERLYYLDPESQAEEEVRELTFSQVLNVPSSPESPPSQAFVVPQTNSFGQPVPLDYRPHSAHSSIHSTSDYSFSATDIDEDSAMSENTDPPDLGVDAMHLDPAIGGAKFWQNVEGSRRDSSGPSTLPWGHSEIAPSISPDLGGSNDGNELETAENRNKRLEHRREINRRSARKHRTRRREEHEVLTRTIAEKDARIAELEKELAVEKGKIGQLVHLVKGGGLRVLPSSGKRKEGSSFSATPSMPRPKAQH